MNPGVLAAAPPPPSDGKALDIRSIKADIHAVIGEGREDVRLYRAYAMLPPDNAKARWWPAATGTDSQSPKRETAWPEQQNSTNSQPTQEPSSKPSSTASTLERRSSPFTARLVVSELFALSGAA